MQVLTPLFGYFVEWRARRIRDPIARLRFLKQHTARPGEAGIRPRWDFVAVMVLVGCLTIAAAVRANSFVNVARLGPPRMGTATVAAPADVWLVEEREGVALYSNGLRIDNRYATRNEPRSYRAFNTEMDPSPFRAEPAGIVFHTTESLLAPFAPGYNDTLQRLSQELLEHIRTKRSYHFLIDRFGRVCRIVREEDSANHAGYSVWADQKWKYINLNHSFLGVSFETQTRPGGEPPTISPAQIHAGRMLTEMLRGKYRIAAKNCVTHAQVSVNAANMLVGHHTDWAANFPFPQMGLPDNYAEPLPSLYAFGFGYDPAYVKATGASVWQSLLLSEERLRSDALAFGLPFQAYRDLLRQNYRQMIKASKESDAHKETD